MFFHFDKTNTFCISLESKPERWSRMEQRFQYFTMDVTRWVASTPSTLSDSFVHYLNVFQRACAQSHINLWKHMIQHELPYVLIMEDDAMFDKEWVSRLNEIEPILKTDTEWHAVFLNVSEPNPTMFQWISARDQYLTGAYILSLGGAKRLLQMFSHEYASADWMTTRLQTHGHSYTYFPWLVIQEGYESTIGSGVEADHAKVLRCLGEIHYDLHNYI